MREQVSDSAGEKIKLSVYIDTDSIKGADYESIKKLEEYKKGGFTHTNMKTVKEMLNNKYGRKMARI